MLSFEHTPEFKKDAKKLSKRWRSIPSDIKTAEAALRVVYSGDEEIYRQFFATKRAAVISKSNEAELVKMRIDCKSLGNDKKVRLVFILLKMRDTIQLVEVFAKNDKSRENQSRIQKYMK